MSLLHAYGQVLRDIAKGRRVVLVNLDSPDAALSMKVLQTVLQETGCCSSIEATASQCVARTKHGTLPQLASAILAEHYKTQRSGTRCSPTVEKYIRRNPDTHEAEHLACLLSDASASYILEVFTSVHEPTAREDVPLLPPGCTHVTLTDGHGSFLGLLFAPASSQQAPPSLADLQGLKSAAAACLGSFREVHPTAAVVLAGVYHEAFKLNLLEDSQPEALTLIQALQQTHQQLHPPPQHPSPSGQDLPAGAATSGSRQAAAGPRQRALRARNGGRGIEEVFEQQAGVGGRQGLQAKQQPGVDFWVAAGAVAAVAVGGVAMLVRHAVKGSQQSDG